MQALKSPRHRSAQDHTPSCRHERVLTTRIIWCRGTSPASKNDEVPDDSGYVGPSTPKIATSRARPFAASRQCMRLTERGSAFSVPLGLNGGCRAFWRSRVVASAATARGTKGNNGNAYPAHSPAGRACHRGVAGSFGNWSAGLGCRSRGLRHPPGDAIDESHEWAERRGVRLGIHRKRDWRRHRVQQRSGAADHHSSGQRSSRLVLEPSLAHQEHRYQRQPGFI